MADTPLSVLSSLLHSRKRAQILIDKLEARGWVVVPKEATLEMTTASFVSLEIAARMYEDMIQARPR